MDALEQKIDLAMQEEFVGNIIFSDSELADIYEKVGGELRDVDCTWGATMPISYDKWTFVALVNIIKSWDSSEDTFLGFIYKKLLGTDGSQKVYNYITSVIERLDKAGKIIFLDTFKKKYYATILAHAFAPLKSTKAFFDLCWQIYCEDLNSDYIPYDGVYKQIAFQLQSKLSDLEKESDDFELGSHPYAFRAGIKGLAISRPDRMALFIENTIRSIDKLFNGDLIDSSKYFPNLIRDWWKQKENSFGERNKKKTTSERAITDYAAIKPKYLLSDNTVCLHIPSIRLSEHLDKQPFLTIKSGEKILKCIGLCTKGSGLSMMTKAENFNVSDIPFPNNSIDISVDIDHCYKNIYRSGISLKRSFILFKDDREVYAQECAPGNYSLFLLDLDSLYQYPQEINRLSADLFTIYAAEGEVLQSSERTVIFANELQQQELQFKMKKQNNAVFCKAGEDYIVIDGDIGVAADASLNISNYGVRYESTSFRITEFTKVISNTVTYYSVTELLEAGTPQKLSVFRYSDNKTVAAINIVKFNNIEVIYDKEIYYDSNSYGKVHFITDDFYKTSPFDISQDEILLPFEEGELKLYPPVLKWKIDASEYHKTYLEEGIYYKNLTNSSELNIELPPTFSCEICLSSNTILPHNKVSNNSWKLGEKIYSLLSKPNSDKEIIAFARLGDNILCPIVRLFLKQQFKDTPFYKFGYHSIVWNPKDVFVGERNTSFKLILKREEDVVAEYLLGLKKQLLDFSRHAEGYYTIQIDTVSSGTFIKAETLYNEQLCIGNEKEVKYKDSKLHVAKVMLSGKSQPTSIVPFYIENLEFLGEQDGSDFYSGTIYVTRYNGSRKYLNSMPDDKGNYDRINPIRIEMRNKNSCWIVSGVSKENFNIFNDEFTLDSENKISNRDNYTNAIDYYYFTQRRNNNV